MKGKLTIDELLLPYKQDNANFDNNTEAMIENLVNILGAMMEAINKLGSELSQRLQDESKLKTMNNYLSISKNDINDYEILFKNKSYANAIYHMEQSIEKIAKSFYFLSSASPDPKKINHKPFKIIIKFVEEYEIFKILEKQYGKPFLEAMDTFLGDEDRIVKINKAEFEHIIKFIETLNRFTEQSENNEKIVMAL